MSNTHSMIHQPPPKPRRPDEPWSEAMSHWYTQNYGEHPCNTHTIQWTNLVAHDHLLDIGCGSGSAVRSAAERLTNGTAVGVDYAPTMVTIAKAKTVGHPHEDRISFEEAEAGALPFPDKAFTVVTAINTLHHWPNPKAGLAETARVLTADGRLIICEEIFAEPDHGLDADAIVALLAENGFKIQNQTTSQAGDTDVILTRAVVSAASISGN